MEWLQVSLGNYVETQKGFAFKSEWFAHSGHQIVKVSNFSDDSIDASQLVCIPDEIGNKYLRYALFPGDVVVQTVGSWPSNPASVVGKCVRVPKKLNGALLNQNAVRLSPKEGLDKRFLFYLLKDSRFKTFIVGTAQGAASQAAITLDSIRAYEFLLPSPSTQGRIASILSAYDDLIENNTRRIAILEEMARRIYEEWFVRFRFPGHEQVKMVESELGVIPEGWSIIPVTRAVEVNPKIRIPKEGLKPFVPMASASNHSMIIGDLEQREGNSGSKFQNGDTLFARITPCLENGRTGFVQFLPSGSAVAFGSTEFIVLRSLTLCPEYVYALARSDEFRAIAIKSMSGATGRQRVREACFDSFLLAQPDEQTLQCFQKFIKPMFNLIWSLNRKNVKLRATRDLLLPKLISGELDVSDLPEPEETIAA